VTYCTETDVAIRLGLDSAQRTRASSRITSAISRAVVYINQEFRDYGRAAPTSATGEDAAVLKEICGDLSASIYLEDDTAFHTSGSDPVRSNVLRQRALEELQRLAHLGSVN
tara:strand:- start:947 stop:1282 length:336 start_codon:yes stop_codon:yes gene_type:complete